MTQSKSPRVYRLIGPYTSGELAGVFDNPFYALMSAHVRAYSGYKAGQKVREQWASNGVPMPDGFTTSNGRYGLEAYWKEKPQLEMGLFTKPTRIRGGSEYVSRLRGKSAVKKEFRELWKTLKDLHRREFDELYDVPIALEDIAGIDVLASIFGGFSFRMAFDYKAREVYVEVSGAEVTTCVAEESTYAKFGELLDHYEENNNALQKEVKARYLEFKQAFMEGTE